VKICRKKKWGETGAKIEAARMSAKKKSSLRAYRCDICKSWHVGRTEKVDFLRKWEE